MAGLGKQSQNASSPISNLIGHHAVSRSFSVQMNKSNNKFDSNRFEQKQNKRLKELEERLMKGTKVGAIFTNPREKQIVFSGFILTLTFAIFSILFTVYRVYDTWLQKQIRRRFIYTWSIVTHHIDFPTPFVRLTEDTIDCVDFFGHSSLHIPSKNPLPEDELEEIEKKAIK